jgi:hypothetical protein
MGRQGFEPWTKRLRVSCSTAELTTFTRLPSRFERAQEYKAFACEIGYDRGLVKCLALIV